MLTAMETWMRSFARILAAAVIANASLISGSGAIAQDQPQSQSPAPSPADPMAEVPDQKLDAAAAAIEQVANVKEKYQQQFDAADAADRDRIADEAKNAMEKAVTDQGLSIEEYASILVVAQNHPQVRERLLQRIRPSNKM
jgi:hypothetical protein